MKKTQVVWLIIRLAGVYFAYQALFMAATFLGQLILVGKASETNQQNAFPVLLISFVQLAFYIAASIYMIGDGSKLFDILNREDRAISEESNGSQLNLDE